jgi:hypothetical protein
MVVRSRAFQLLAVGALAVNGAAHAQQAAGRSVTLRGTVIDTSHHPVAGVLVYLSTEGLFTLSDKRGVFVLPGVTRDVDTLQFRGMALAPVAFRLTLPDSAQHTLEVGTVLLSPGPAPTLDLTASLRDTVQHRPVEGAQVMVNDSVVGVTDSAGSLSRQKIPIDWGMNSVLVRRLGYAPLFRTFWVGDLDARRSLDGFMNSLAVDVPGVVVEADRITFAWGRLREFWRRRGTGLGRFFTRTDILERHPARISDLLNAVPGLLVFRQGGRMRILSTHGVPYCVPLIWVDGVRYDSVDELDAEVSPQDVDGIEVYLRGGETPVQYSAIGNSCGAIVVWT